MKIKKIIFFLFFFFISFENIYAITTDEAIETIDLSKKCNLSIEYSYNNESLNNIDVSAYLVANLTKNVFYAKEKQFKNLDIKLNNIKTDEEWNLMNSTIGNYIDSYSINATYRNKNNNEVLFNNIQPGLYIIKTKPIELENSFLEVKDILVNLPSLNEDGTWKYDVKLNPKSEKYRINDSIIKNKIIVTWVGDNLKIRPRSVSIEIYKNSELYNIIELSPQNNWTYEWKTIDNNDNWSVIEKINNKSYKVIVNKQNANIIIINKVKQKTTKNPKTGDNIYLYLFILGGSLLGLTFLIIYYLLNKKREL